MCVCVCECADAHMCCAHTHAHICLHVWFCGSLCVCVRACASVCEEDQRFLFLVLCDSDSGKSPGTGQRRRKKASDRLGHLWVGGKGPQTDATAPGHQCCGLGLLLSLSFPIQERKIKQHSHHAPDLHRTGAASLTQGQGQQPRWAL